MTMTMPSNLPKRKFEKVGEGLHTERRMVNAKVLTFCDFGEEGRKTQIGQHLTYATAMAQYARLWNTYHRLHGYKVWQEEVKSQETKADGQG